jgi:hypothetical protein
MSWAMACIRCWRRAGRADGLNAADAGRDGVGVRRDADLPRAAEADHGPAKRKALLAGKVEDMLNTVVRQIAFYQFERKVHTAAARAN